MTFPNGKGDDQREASLVSKVLALDERCVYINTFTLYRQVFLYFVLQFKDFLTFNQFLNVF